jgi:hypothetical protein
LFGDFGVYLKAKIKDSRAGIPVILSEENIAVFSSSYL